MSGTDQKERQKAFGTKLSEMIARSEHGSVAVFAVALGVSRITVYKWLRGQVSPRFEQLHDIAGALDVPVSVLLMYEGAVDPRLAGFMEALASAAPDRREATLHSLEGLTRLL